MWLLSFYTARLLWLDGMNGVGLVAMRVADDAFLLTAFFVVFYATFCCIKQSGTQLDNNLM